jgi:hypothetical protein
MGGMGFRHKGSDKGSRGPPEVSQSAFRPSRTRSIASGALALVEGQYHRIAHTRASSFNPRVDGALRFGMEVSG